MAGSKRCAPGCECSKHNRSTCPPDCECGKHERGERSPEHRAALSQALRGNQNSRRHGESTRTRRTPENAVWQAMRGRCLQPNNKRWADYGGRGITVDPRWDSYENFLADMGRRPGPEYSIDRRDNDGPYSPENCYWATTAQQAANKRSTRDADRHPGPAFRAGK